MSFGWVCKTTYNDLQMTLFVEVIEKTSSKNYVKIEAEMYILHAIHRQILLLKELNKNTNESCIKIYHVNEGKD